MLIDILIGIPTKIYTICYIYMWKYLLWRLGVTAITALRLFRARAITLYLMRCKHEMFVFFSS